MLNKLQLKKILLNILQYSLFLGLSILLLYLAFKNIDFNTIIGTLKHTRYQYIIISLLLGLIGIYIRAYRWKIIIEPLGYSPNMNNVYHAVAIGYMANYAFPRIGEVVRCGVLSRTNKIPGDSLIGTVLAERIFDVLVLFFLTILVILLKMQLFGAFFIEKVFLPLSEKISNLFGTSYVSLFFIAISIIATAFIIYNFRAHILQITLVKKIGRLSKGIFEGSKSIFRIKRLTQFIVHSILMWSVYWLMTYTFLLSLEPTSNLTLLDALFVMVAGSYGMAAPVQAGIGAYHVIIGLSLSIYLISWNDAMAFALLSHGAQAIGIILVGLISLSIIFLRRRKQLKDISVI